MFKFTWPTICMVACSYFAADILSAELPQPYRDIQILPYDAQSMYRNGAYLEKLIHERSVKTVVEVGCWLGASTCHMASLLPEGGKVYAVDHWLGSSEHQPGQWCYFPVLPRLYQQFLSNVIHKSLTDKIIPVRMDSLQASRTLQVAPDLIYIDASHDTESVYKDLKAWYPFVQGHGVICGDDWDWPSVSKAVILFANENNLRITSSEYFWQIVE